MLAILKATKDLFLLTALCMFFLCDKTKNLFNYQQPSTNIKLQVVDCEQAYT